MKVNSGKDAGVPTSDNFKGEPIWNDGMGVLLRNSIEVNPGDNIIAVFYASNQSKVMVSSYYELEGTRNYKWRLL